MLGSTSSTTVRCDFVSAPGRSPCWVVTASIAAFAQFPLNWVKMLFNPTRVTKCSFLLHLVEFFQKVRFEALLFVCFVFVLSLPEPVSFLAHYYSRPWVGLSIDWFAVASCCCGFSAQSAVRIYTPEWRIHL